MPPEDDGLPKFRKPPLGEVAISVQFSGLNGLQVRHVGALHSIYSDSYPGYDEHPPLDQQVEQFDLRADNGPQLQLSLAHPGMPRVWFVSDDGCRLVQVQADRFVLNWRETPEGGDYPHFDDLRETFLTEFGRLRNFASEHGLGTIEPNQCEITYINHVMPNEHWTSHSDISPVVTTWSPIYSDDTFPPPTDVRFTERRVIPGDDGEPIGRVYTHVDPVFRLPDETPMLLLKFIGRGRPYDGSMEGVKRFLDLSHEWIVKAFAATTTPEMHKRWERYA